MAFRGGVSKVLILTSAGLSEIADEIAAKEDLIPVSQKDAANGVATLDADKHIPAAQMNLGTAATSDATDFDAAGTATAAIAALNLGDVVTHDASDFEPAGTATAAITALGLGDVVTHDASDFDAAGAGATAAANAVTALNLGDVVTHDATDFEAAGSIAALIASLPIADPAVAGQIWNDSGVLKVSAGP